MRAARWATSAEAGVACNQACGRVCTHCLASVVLPYPAGARSKMTCAEFSSSRRVKRGRSMMWRLPCGGCLLLKLGHPVGGRRIPLVTLFPYASPAKMSQKDAAPATREAAGAGAVSPRSGWSAPRLWERGSRPVSVRYALGICLRLRNRASAGARPSGPSRFSARCRAVERPPRSSIRRRSARSPEAADP